MENEKKTPVQKVETLSGDMVKVLEHPEEGLIKKLIKEEEAHEEEKKNFSPESGKNKLLMIGSFLLLALAMGGLIYFFANQESFSIEVKPEFTPLIYTDETTFIPIDGLKKEDTARKIFSKLATTEVKEGGVEGIYLSSAKKVIGLRGFLTHIGGTLPIEKNNFFGDELLIGIAKKETTDLFFLIKIRSHTDVFEAMREWENKMFSDLHGFFGYPITPQTNYLLTKNFEDGIIQNQNARVLYDKNGGIVFAYIYADTTSIVITNTESSAREVIARLAGSRVKK